MGGSLLLLRTISRYLLHALAAAVVCSTVAARTDTPFQMRTGLKNCIIWQNFGSMLMTTEDLTAGRVCYHYDYLRRIVINMKEAQPGSWMPLGAAIKWLMYADNYQGLDRLMAHDVDFHNYHIAWLSNQKQVGVGMRDTTCVFGQYRANAVGDHYPVDLYSFDVARGGATPLCVSDSEKSQFAHDGNLIVYRANYGYGDVRICGIYYDGGGEFTIAQRPGFEPSVCGPLVAWYEVNGPGYNIMGKNLITGEIRTIAYTTANPPRPEAGRGAIFWEDNRNAATTGVDIYGYDWDTGEEYAVTTASGDQLKLRVCGDLVTWTKGPTSNETLWGARILTPVRISDLSVTLVTPSSIALGWTSVGTTSNPATLYDLRMRTDGPITDANWASSTQVSGLPAPSAAGQAESFTVEPLSTGHYYFAIKAQLQNGEWSALSDCVAAYVSDESSAVRHASIGASISFTGVVSGIGSGGAFYCQRSDRPQAVRVIPKTAQSLTVGQRVTVTGVLVEDADLRGPVIDQASVSLNEGTEAVRPLGMHACALGGFDSRYGGTEQQGPSNLWMRVKVWGRVSDLSTTDGCSFYLDDGSNLTDNAGRGVFVTSRFAAPSGLANGGCVAAEGICRLHRTDGRQIEVVEDTGIRVQ